MTDDIDGSPDARIVTFELDGVTYSIQLGELNRGRLTDALALFMQHASRRPSELLSADWAVAAQAFLVARD